MSDNAASLTPSYTTGWDTTIVFSPLAYSQHQARAATKQGLNASDSLPAASRAEDEAASRAAFDHCAACSSGPVDEICNSSTPSRPCGPGPATPAAAVCPKTPELHRESRPKPQLRLPPGPFWAMAASGARFSESNFRCGSCASDAPLGWFLRKPGFPWLPTGRRVSPHSNLVRRFFPWCTRSSTGGGARSLRASRPAWRGSAGPPTLPRSGPR